MQYSYINNIYLTKSLYLPSNADQGKAVRQFERLAFLQTGYRSALNILIIYLILFIHLPCSYRATQLLYQSNNVKYSAAIRYI